MPRVFYDTNEFDDMTDEELEVMRLKYKEKKERYYFLINEEYDRVSALLDLIDIEISKRENKNKNI